MNGQIYGHEYGCDWESKDFVFVHGGRTNLDPDFEYWGGIRFSVKEFEQELFHSRIHDAVTHSSITVQDSVLQFVQVRDIFSLHRFDPSPVTFIGIIANGFWEEGTV